MAKHRADISIGYRAHEAVADRAYALNMYPGVYCKNVLGIDRKLFTEWFHGTQPSAYSLQSLAMNGFDVHYILTGFKRNAGDEDCSEIPDTCNKLETNL